MRVVEASRSGQALSVTQEEYERL